LFLKLHGFGYKIHLWTARDEQSARRILNQHNIETFFTTLSFATVVDSKSHARSLKFNWKEVFYFQAQRPKHLAAVVLLRLFETTEDDHKQFKSVLFHTPPEGPLIEANLDS